MASPENQFRFIYLVGTITTFMVLCGIVVDMMVGSITGGDLTALPETAIGRFDQFSKSWILGLYNLDLLNVINQIILIPSILAVYIAHRRTDNGYALLAFILFLVGSTIFIASNTALTMLDLSRKYLSAVSEDQRNFIIAAGEAMLAKGEHGSSGVFIGFVLPTFAMVLLSHGMIRGKIFSKATSYFGLVGNILMLLYIIVVTFFPAAEKYALMIAMPGGLLVMAWMILFMVKLFRLSRAGN